MLLDSGYQLTALLAFLVVQILIVQNGLPLQEEYISLSHPLNAKDTPQSL